MKIYPFLIQKTRKNSLKNLFINTLRYSSSSISKNDEIYADFSAPIWKKSILFGLCAFIVYKMDQWYALHHEGKGPFTRIIEYYMMDEEECIRQHINRIKILSEKAKKRLSYQNAQRSFIYKLKFPEQFDKENFSTNIETKTNNY